MTFWDTLTQQLRGMSPGMLVWVVLPLIPFIIAEQIWPVHRKPRIRDYGMNILIALTTPYLAMPLGIAAGLWSKQVREWLPWGADLVHVQRYRQCAHRRCSSRDPGDDLRAARAP